MIGELHGSPDEVFLAARALFHTISPLGVARLDGGEIVFETVWAKGFYSERLPARDGLAKELVRHAGVLSLKMTVYETAGSA